MMASIATTTTTTTNTMPECHEWFDKGKRVLVEWKLDGKRHRKERDGPAIIWSDGRQEWWVDGKLLRKEY